MKIKIIRLFIACVFLPLFSNANNQEDSSTASVELSVRYVLVTKESQKTSRTISYGETGNIPITMNLQLDVQPFLWLESPFSSIFFVSKSRFGQDRTSSEFGIGLRKKHFEVFVSYGFRAIRTGKEGVAKGLSSGFDNQETKSICSKFDLKVFGIKTDFFGNISLDGRDKFFYEWKTEIYPFVDYFPVHIFLFHESFFGSGTCLVYLNNEESSKVFLGYLLPENRSERIYRRSQGFLFGLTHTWK